MWRRLSKLGIIFSGIYLIFSIIAVVYSFLCNGMFCGFIIVAPAIPWIYLFEWLLLSSWISFSISVILNTIIVYFIGIGISKPIRKIVFSRSD